jgi:PAS domain S-box-containing protein
MRGYHDAVEEQNRIGASTGSLEMLFQLKGVGVVQTDPETGRPVRANREFCEMVGYTEAELQGMTNAELTQPDDWAHDVANLIALQRGELHRDDTVTRVLRRDSAVVWLELHVSIVEEAGHTYTRTLGCKGR